MNPVSFQKHPHYEEVNELTSVITAYDGDEEIFVEGLWKLQKIYTTERKSSVKRELAYFNDSIQRPARYQD